MTRMIATTTQIATACPVLILFTRDTSPTMLFLRQIYLTTHTQHKRNWKGKRSAQRKVRRMLWAQVAHIVKAENSPV